MTNSRRNVAAFFNRPAVSAVAGLLALVDAGSTELLLVEGWHSVDSAPPATTTYANAKVLLLGAGVHRRCPSQSRGREAFSCSPDIPVRAASTSSTSASVSPRAFSSTSRWKTITSY